MTVVCAIPVRVPVYRVRATVRCRELGTALHTNVRRLAEYAGEQNGFGKQNELIAAALGLPLKRIEEVRGELAHRLALTERAYLIWVDHARGRCLPYSALDGICVRYGDGAGLLLPVDPPTPASLRKMGLSAAASWDTGVDGHVEVDEVLDVSADVRGSTPDGKKHLSHVLRLPDVHLLVAFDDDRPDELRISLTQHAIENDELTHWLHDHYGEARTSEILDLEHIRPGAEPPRWLSDLTDETERETDQRWRQMEPRPDLLRQQIADVADAAEDRLAVCAPDLGHLPAWLEDTLERTLEREVPVVLCPEQAQATPKERFFSSKTVLSEQPGALCVIADTTCAVVHTDAHACLDLGDGRKPRPQHIRVTHQEAAVCKLLELLDLGAPQKRTASEKLGGQAIRRMLDEALIDLSEDLPSDVTAAIEPEDERFAAETLDRYARRGESPTQGMHGVAAGIAWERALIVTGRNLTDTHHDLEFVTARWSPPEGRIDLDLIIRDHAKRIVWVLDAKNADPTIQQQGTMLQQIRVVPRHPEISTEDWSVMGLIVHRSRQLQARQTEEPAVLRCGLDELPHLLLTDALPDQRLAA